ncbi:MAG: hypothetical protein ACYTKD_28010 [Planctomycetota bacterium]|jgi:hypothetical protein
MRYGPDDRFWVTIDPTPESEDGDCVFETSLRKLDLQFKGGLTMDRNPTLFTDENEARIEAFGRLTAMRASRAISERLRSGEDVDLPLKIEVHGANGEILFRATITTDGAVYDADIAEDA